MRISCDYKNRKIKSLPDPPGQGNYGPGFQCVSAKEVNGNFVLRVQNAFISFTCIYSVH